MLQPAQTAAEPATTQKAEAAAENVMTVAKDPRYARYLKMVQVVRRHLLQDYNDKEKEMCVFFISLYVLSVSGSSSYGYKE